MNSGTLTFSQTNRKVLVCLTRICLCNHICFSAVDAKRRWNSTAALLGAEVEMLSRFKDAPQPGMTQPGMENKVMHASFRIGETILMASDGRCEGQPRFEGFSLSIVVPDEEKAESVFNALADGGKVTMPLEKTFWAPKFGMLEDRFGVGWMVSVQHKP